MIMRKLEPELLVMISHETAAALICLRRVHDAWQVDDARRDKVKRVSAVITLIEEVERSYDGHVYTPREVVPWLKCSTHLLARTDGHELHPAKEHVSAACDLLSAYTELTGAKSP
jgi:hypothetical protein